MTARRLAVCPALRPCWQNWDFEPQESAALNWRIATRDGLKDQEHIVDRVAAGMDVDLASAPPGIEGTFSGPLYFTAGC